MRRHILPNLMHIVLIALVMDFSGLVLAEAVLSYVGIGVDPTHDQLRHHDQHAARMELAREPMVWWSLAAAFASCSPWCWRPTCSPTPCATPSIRAAGSA
jgi:peptide/nickel transport system permease protein